MTAIDLFAGAGGFSLGLQQAGIQVVAAVEWDKDAAATYRAMIGDHVIESDIATVQIADLPDADLIAGSPPCQGYSYAGKRAKDDPRNQLWREFLRIVEGKRPSFVLIENVRGIITNGDDRKILDAFRGIGYRMERFVLCAHNYGVPQSRYRVFFIGNRLDLPIKPPKITHVEPHQVAVSGLLPWVTVREALGIGGQMTHKYSVTEAIETDGRTSPWYDADSSPARTVSHEPHKTMDSPSANGRAGTHGQPGYSPRHPGGYVVEERLNRDGLVVANGGRHGRVGSAKHPGNFVPTVRIDHGLIDPDRPSCAIKAGGNTDASGHLGGACPPSMPNVPMDSPSVLSQLGESIDADEILDSPSSTIRARDGYDGAKIGLRRPSMIIPNVPLDSPAPTIQGGGIDTGGAEQVRHRLKNRYAEHGDGASVDSPASTISVDRGLEEHWLAGLFEVSPTIQADASVSLPGHYGPGEPRMTYRRLTVRECATLQDFPEWFAFSGSKTSQHRQLGNAVPPGMARALAETIVGLGVRS